jgi:hypothetical protein
MPNKRLRLPLSFDEALSSLLQVKPPAKEPAVRKAKPPSKKRAAKKR